VFECWVAACLELTGSPPWRMKNTDLPFGIRTG